MKKSNNKNNKKQFAKKGDFKSSKRENRYDAKEKYEDNKDKHAYGNDISWYVNDPQLLTDACNITFANTLCEPLPVGLFGGGASSAKTELPCPGVMVLNVVPSIGHILRDPTKYQRGDMWDSAVNMAARAEWSFIRQKNAGAKNYDAPDLMMYHLAMDNVYMYWSWMVRIYGYLRLYSFKNKYYPYGILRAMGLNDAAIEDLRANMANFRTYINLYAAQMSSFAVPNNLPYVKRHLWIFQNAFTDATTTKSQVYLYNPEVLFRLNEVTDQPMSLEAHSMPMFKKPTDASDGWALADIKERGDALIAPIVKSESAVIMSGDILKAYDPSNIYAFQSIPDDFSLVPIYDETVLSQIHNANIITSAYDWSEGHPENCRIAQDASIDAGYIYQICKCENSGVDGVVIDSRFESPTPSDVMYATRLTSVRNTDHPYYYDTGSEFVANVVLFANAKKGSEWEDAIYVLGGSNRYESEYTLEIKCDGNNKCNASAVLKLHKFLANLTKFDWYPLVTLNFLKGAAPAITEDYHGIVGDVDNFAIVRAMTISKMHKVALNSEFGLPYLLTSVK